LASFKPPPLSRALPNAFSSSLRPENAITGVAEV
jgi:hypothetical protein